jgi:hypothetical protein
MTDPSRAPATDPWWNYTRQCATALRAGHEPPALAAHGPLLHPNEALRLSAPAHYSRLAAGDGSYHHASAPFLVNPILMAGAMAAQGAINRNRRHRAEHDTHPTWRNQRPAAVLATNLRLMCSRPEGGWVSFWYQDLAEFYPEPERRTLTMAFTEEHTTPLQLSGPATPAISLWAAHAIYGPAWEQHPSLAALITDTQSRNQHQPEQQAAEGLTEEQRH